jgi:hypothetical protein
MKTITKIIRAFLERGQSMTIKDLSKTIHSDYRITHCAVQRLLTDKVLLSSRVGSATLCRLDPQYYGMEIITAEEERRREVFKDKNIKQLHRDLMTKLDTTLFVLILHARNRFPGINLLFISNEANFKRKVEQVLNQIPLQIHADILTEQDFKQGRFTNSSNQNLSPMQSQNKFPQGIILHNMESYYLLKGNP